MKTGELRGGACMDLPLAVVDKYWFASQRQQPFEYYTALAICGHCAIRAACLEDAIGSPGVISGSEHMVRAGEPGTAIRNLRRRHFLGGEAVGELAAQVLATQPLNQRTPGDFKYLRDGRFDDAELVGEAS